MAIDLIFKKFLVANVFCLDRYSKLTIIHFILSSPASITDSFHDLQTCIIDNLDLCYVLRRGLSSNLKNLIENQPNTKNKVSCS